jgi:hypothetical protein
MKKCEVCEVRPAVDGRFCSALCGWAAVLGGTVRQARKNDVASGTDVFEGEA